MLVVDVDSHQEPGSDWLDDVPHLKDQLTGRMFPESDPRTYIEPPSPQAVIEFAVAGLVATVQAGLPPEERMPFTSMVSPHYERAFGTPFGQPIGAFEYEGADQFQPINPAKRLPWLEKQGIAYQNIINVKGISGLATKIEDVALGIAAIEHLNTYMSDRLEGYTDRLNLVTTLRYEDIEWSVREMTRMRERGSRAFFLPGQPINLIPPYDAYFDPIWAAACDLGMIGILHVGGAPAYWHPGWGNTSDPTMIRYLGSTNSHLNAHIMINVMVFGGVFERFPKFAMLISEFGLGWLPYTVKSMDARASQGGERLHGKYRLSLKPSEFVRRNVRISGLPGQDPRDIVEAVPESIVFASDYPHMEGTPEPIEVFSKFMEDQSEETRRRYFGGSILEVYERMGDPLPIANAQVDRG